MEKEPVADGTSTYARDPDGDLVGLGTPGGAWAPLTDTHGDVVAAFTTNGAGLTDQKVFDPFGVPTTAGSANVRVGFQGSWTDPTTAKVSAQARWYTPSIGRFISRDSVDLPLSGSAGVNRYLYANANPLAANDLSGHLQGTVVGCAVGAPVGPEGCAAGAAVGTIIEVGIAAGYVFYSLFHDEPRPAPRPAPQPTSAPSDGLLDYYWFPDIAIDPDIFPAPDGGPVAGGTGRGPSQTRTQTRTSIRTQSTPPLKRDTRIPPLPAPRVKPVPPAGTVVSPAPNIEWPDGWSPDGAPYVPEDCVPGTCADSLPSGDGAAGQGTDGGCGLAEGSLPLATTCRPDEPDPDPAAAGGAGRPPGDGNPPAPSGHPDDDDPSRHTEDANGRVETFYRAMSKGEYAALRSSGGLSPRGESFVTQDLEYVQQLAARHPDLYEIFVRFDMQVGTRDALLAAGARDPLSKQLVDAGLDDLPLIGKGMKNVVHVKGELNAITYGLRSGSASIFNSRILGLSTIEP